MATPNIVPEDLLSAGDAFLTTYSYIHQKMIDTEEEKVQLNKDVMHYRQHSQALETECRILRDTVQDLQDGQSLTCNYEDEISNLKKIIADAEKCLQNEILAKETSLQTLTQQHQEDVESLTQTLQAQFDSKIHSLEVELHAVRSESRDLASQLTAAGLDKEREVHRISLEYEAKLRIANAQKTEYNQQQRQIMNQDVMRKKMQHMEKDIQSLKAQLRAYEGGPSDVCDVDAESHDTPGAPSDVRGQNLGYHGKFTTKAYTGRFQRRGNSLLPH